MCIGKGLKVFLVYIFFHKIVDAFSGYHFIKPSVPSSCLFASFTESSVLEHFELSSEFNRWRFLKDLLEEDESIEDFHVNHLLYVVLKSFYDNPPPLKLEDGNTNPSPILTPKQRDLLDNALFQYKDGLGIIEVFVDGDMKANDEVLKALEYFQPDEIEEEEAFKSAWDIVVVMYGVEATKQAQLSKDPSFYVRSTVVRLLLHFDFLVSGISN